jgi:hypothetical protein
MKKIEKLTEERDRLRKALVGLVGVDTIVELKVMEALTREAEAFNADKVAIVNAINVLIEIRE